MRVRLFVLLLASMPAIAQAQTAQTTLPPDINPPDIRIRDFGSLNGTFVHALVEEPSIPYQSAAEFRRALERVL